MGAATSRFRERVTIQEKNLVDNGRGGRKRPDGGLEWIDVATVFAEVIPLRGDEALEHQVLRSVQLYKVTVRARDDVTAATQLLWGSTKLDIHSVAFSIDRRDLVMTCGSGRPT
jgi:head-tail adaptor